MFSSQKYSSHPIWKLFNWLPTVTMMLSRTLLFSVSLNLEKPSTIFLAFKNFGHKYWVLKDFQSIQYDFFSNRNTYDCMTCFWLVNYFQEHNNFATMRLLSVFLYFHLYLIIAKSKSLQHLLKSHKLLTPDIWY